MSATAIDAEKTQETAAQLADRLPIPAGYKMLVVKPEIEEKSDGGIVYATETRKKEEQGAVVGLVLRQGPLCYKDPDKFPTGAWCKEGDFVLLRAYSGSRFSVDGKEFIIVNDDQIEGVVVDPRGIGRAY
jgi:co-chaperonin GroES (HSP10)